MRSTDFRREARRFALEVAALAALAGAWLLWRKHRPAPALGAAVGGGALVLLSLAVPRAVWWLRRGWLAVGHGLGWVNARLLLGVVFLVFLSPFALLKRAFGRKGFPNAAGGSYFVEREPLPPDHYEHPY